MMLLYLIIFVCFISVRCQDIGLSEGSPCSWNGVSGRCTHVHRCLSTVVDIFNRNYPPICYFNGRTPITCCTDCELVNDTRLILFDRKLGMLNKTGNNKAKDKCLEYIYQLDYPCKGLKQNIISSKMFDQEKRCSFFEQHYPSSPPYGGGASGGTDAKRGEFPHMALLGYGESVETADWLCGGSVISEKYILTAAHCLSAPTTGPVRFIGLGILQRSDPAELWQRYLVKRAIPHPEFRPPSKYHDIALLETDRLIAFNSAVRPACLHIDDQMDRFAVATGWGALGHRQQLADVLQAVGLHQFSKEECASYYPIHRHLRNGYDHRTQMCYGDNKESVIPTDTCQGDSGGPLQSTEHEQCVYTILGVTSYGRRCGESGGTGMYTRVSHYVSWIEDVVWP